MSNALLRFVEKTCVQSMWYWAKTLTISDGMNGFTYGEPEILKCRWDGKSQLVVNSDGQQVISVAEILVLQKLFVGDRVMLIPADGSGVAEPTKASIILATVETPLFMSATEFVRTVMV